MSRRLADERGSALVLAMGVLVVLTGIALIIVALAVSNKKSEFATVTQNRAFYSADAAGEAGINWVRTQLNPPGLLDGQNHVYIAAGYVPLTTDQNYKFDVAYVRKHFRPGWSLEYKDFEYRIDAGGTSVQQSEAAIEVGALRLYKEGY